MTMLFLTTSSTPTNTHVYWPPDVQIECKQPQLCQADILFPRVHT